MSARLFVGNLPYDVTEAELRELFSPVGPLSYVFLPVDRETGKRRGFAFVEFGDESHAAEALRRFNDQQFKGRPLALSEARAKDARPYGPPVRPRSPRLPDSYEPPSSLGDSIPRRERRGRDDAKRHAKPGSRNTRSEGAGKRGPRRERAGGRVFGLDVDDLEELEDSYDEVEE
jgi:RNA recognition motif-containing protein